MGNAGAGRGSESEYNNKILLTVISPSVEITNASEEMDLVTLMLRKELNVSLFK